MTLAHFFASQLRHNPICKKVFNKKRKPFNSSKQRLQGTEITTVRRQLPQKNQPQKKSNWRQHHEDFINAIRSAKQVTKALKEGRPLPPPPPPSINPDYIQCPHCSRRFNEAAAQRHIKFCEEQAIRRAFAAKTTRQALRPLQEYCRKPEKLQMYLLEKRLQESLDNAIRVAPILGHTELCQSSKKAFQLLLDVVVVLSYKGMAQMISISHPCEMHTTAENEILAENVAKMDSL
ncbi:Zc2hc1b [Columba livia]|nr:Zc2hc1b [Columba livia]